MTHHRPHPYLALALALGVLSTLGPPSLAAAQTPSVTVTLAPQNNSGLSGTASLTDLGGGRTRVELKLSGPDGDYPAHVHMGTCANLDPAPQYPLANVRGGTSTTEINASLSSIQQSPHAINLHKSAQDLATYVACGDIQTGAAAPAGATAQPATPSTPNIAAIVAAAPRARDGQCLATQTPATQALFVAVWGDRAATRWVEEHEAELARLRP